MRILELNLERPVRDDRARQSPGIACARSWCARRDSNPHVFRQQDLNLPRLPIPPRARGHPESARPIARIGRGASGSVSGCRSATACGRWRLVDEETSHRPAAATQGTARHPDAAPAGSAATSPSGNAARAARYRHSPARAAGHARTNSGTFWDSTSLQDPEVDAIIDRIYETVDATQREQLSHEFERMLITLSRVTRGVIAWSRPTVTAWRSKQSPCPTPKESCQTALSRRAPFRC